MRYSSGNEIVDKMAGIELTGNITPATWYHTVVNEATGKPYTLAIAILSDIVYWYRPKEVRDETTGEFRGFAKKFKEDLLQRSYQQLEDQFGFSRSQVKLAVVFLEDIGVIKRHFRNVNIRGQQLNNVMYLELIPEKLLS